MKESQREFEAGPFSAQLCSISLARKAQREQLTKVQIGTGRGFGMPAGVPKEAVATMEGILQKAHRSAAWRDYSLQNKYEDSWMGSAEFTKYLTEQRAAQMEFVTSLGLGAKP